MGTFPRLVSRILVDDRSRELSTTGEDDQLAFERLDLNQEMASFPTGRLFPLLPCDRGRVTRSRS